MNISTNNTQTNTFKALVPKSEYKGTILKLTKKDKEQIAELKRQLVELESDTYESIKHRRLKKLWTSKDQFFYSINGYNREVMINCILDKIAEIKRIRLQKQLAKKNFCLTV